MAGLVDDEQVDVVEEGDGTAVIVIKKRRPRMHRCYKTGGQHRVAIPFAGLRRLIARLFVVQKAIAKFLGVEQPARFPIVGCCLEKGVPLLRVEMVKEVGGVGLVVVFKLEEGRQRQVGRVGLAPALPNGLSRFVPFLKKLGVVVSAIGSNFRLFGGSKLFLNEVFDNGC